MIINEGIFPKEFYFNDVFGNGVDGAVGLCGIVVHHRGIRISLIVVAAQPSHTFCTCQHLADKYGADI